MIKLAAVLLVALLAGMAAAQDGKIVIELTKEQAEACKAGGGCFLVTTAQFNKAAQILAEQALEPVIDAAYDKGKEAGCRRQVMWK